MTIYFNSNYILYCINLFNDDDVPKMIPLLPALDGVDVELTVEEYGILITSTVHTTWKTGVEMEALTAISASALTLYDMIKAIDKSARITDIQLLEKTGGKSGDWKR